MLIFSLATREKSATFAFAIYAMYYFDMRIIGHLDMDAFFAAVEERDKPRIKGRPIVVGADPDVGRGRGVVSTANYAARKFGIHSAMPISQAWRLSEAAKARGEAETVFLGVNSSLYGEVSKNIMAIIKKYSSKVEEASVDEAYFEIENKKSNIKNQKLLWDNARSIALKIKEEINKKEKLTCSIGIGPNKLVAKIASDLEKPDGLTLVREEDISRVFDPLPIRKIPGIGPKAEQLFLRQGVKKVSDLKKLSLFDLQKLLGKWGEEIYRKIRGIDETPIVLGYEAKSIGEQETFMVNTRDANFIMDRLGFLCDSVIKRFKRSGFGCFRTIAVTIRFDDFETKTRSYTLPAIVSAQASLFEEKKIDLLKILNFEAVRMILPFIDKRENPERKFIRLIGVRVEKLL